MKLYGKSYIQTFEGWNTFLRFPCTSHSHFLFNNLQNDLLRLSVRDVVSIEFQFAEQIPTNLSIFYWTMEKSNNCEQVSNGVLCIFEYLAEFTLFTLEDHCCLKGRFSRWNVHGETMEMRLYSLLDQTTFGEPTFIFDRCLYFKYFKTCWLIHRPYQYVLHNFARSKLGNNICRIRWTDIASYQRKLCKTRSFPRSFHSTDDVKIA